MKPPQTHVLRTDRSLVVLGAVILLGVTTLLVYLFSAYPGLVPYLVDLSRLANQLQAPTHEQTVLKTVAWVSQRYSDHAAYDAPGHPSPLNWVYGEWASCDQQVALTQRLLYENGIPSESWALFGEHRISRHTVLVVSLGSERVILDPYFGWVLRRPSGEFASFEDVQEGHFALDPLVPPEADAPPMSIEEYAELFAPDHPPRLLGARLSSSYSLRYRMLAHAARLLALPWSLIDREPPLTPGSGHLGDRGAAHRDSAREE